MLNRIFIMGRLTKDPELRYTQKNTPVTSFTVAVERNFGDKQTDFIPCVAWRSTAEFVGKYFFRGSMAVVSGQLHSRKWKDSNGNDRTAWEVLVESVYFGESKQTSGAAKQEAPKFAEDNSSGEELPF